MSSIFLKTDYENQRSWTHWLRFKISFNPFLFDSNQSPPALFLNIIYFREITILAGRPEGCPAKINLAGQTHATSVVELLRHDAPTFNKISNTFIYRAYSKPIFNAQFN